MPNPPDLTLAGRIIRATGCVRIYRDGDGFGEVFRWWHPVTWMIWFPLLIWCGFAGHKISEAVPLSLPPYWQDRKDEIEWL